MFIRWQSSRWSTKQAGGWVGLSVGSACRGVRLFVGVGRLGTLSEAPFIRIPGYKVTDVDLVLVARYSCLFPRGTQLCWRSSKVV